MCPIVTALLAGALILSAFLLFVLEPMVTSRRDLDRREGFAARCCGAHCHH
jgi:hypothetical protein